MIERRFRNWHSWTERKALPRCPGVYAIAHSDRNLAGKAFTLRQEIIYFGMTNGPSGLQGRLQMFDKTISGTRVEHGGADRLRNKYSNYDKLAPKLYIAVADFPCDAKKKEPAQISEPWATLHASNIYASQNTRSVLGDYRVSTIQKHPNTASADAR